MRDFNSGHINGNVTINNNSNNNRPIPLHECTNEELITEMRHRKGLLIKERSRKKRNLLRFLIFASVLMLIAAALYSIQGTITLASLCLGFTSAFTGFASLSALDKPTEFENRQLIALNEINHLLRERNVL